MIPIDIGLGLMIGAMVFAILALGLMLALAWAVEDVTDEYRKDAQKRREILDEMGIEAQSDGEKTLDS